MYKLFIDLEMSSKTKKEYKGTGAIKNEIIQIGAVILDSNNKEVDRLSMYVKPEYTELTSYITGLTGITEADLECAVNIKEALNEIVKFIGERKVTMYTWSESDSIQIINEMKYKNIRIPLIEKLCLEYVDLQAIFNEKVQIENRINLAKALNMIGIDFEGREHGALADAINTAKVYKELDENPDVKCIVDNINSIMTGKTESVTLGNMIDFSKFGFN